ncbi:MAG: hypothetical protein AAFX78_10200 [Cyanobacteria bacterium J06638_20]
MNISHKAWDIYKFIHNFKETKDYSPSIREIMRAMKLKSSAPVQYHLYKLQAAGVLDWVPNDKRTLYRPLSLEEVGAKVYPPLPKQAMPVKQKEA